MAYTKLSDTSFSLSDSGTYSIPPVITNWQTRQMSIIIGGVLKNCKGAGASIVTALLAYATGEDKDGQQAFAHLFGKLSGENFAEDLTGGIGDLLEYNGEHNVTGQILATLFLKENETKVADFDARVEAFDCVPIAQLGGLKDFLASKRGSSTNSPSPSQITEPTSKRKRVVK